MTSAREQLQKLAAERILVFDGGYGTAIQNYRLGEEDYRGSLDLTDDQKGNNDLLSLTRPDIIEAIHTAYLEAGADIVETNTFSSTEISQADYGCEHLVRELNVKSAEIARAACDKAEARDGRPRFVAGSIGPTNKTLSLSPDVNDPGFREIDYDFLKGVYRAQCDALLEGGVDFLLIETIFDTLNAKCAGMAAMEAVEASGRDVPLMISMTLTDLSGRNLSGHTVEAFWHAVRHLKPLTIGLNCSFGADQLRPHLAMLSKEADTLIMAYPNAGLPNDLGEYDEMPQETAELIGDWLKDGLVNIVGGCCGTTPEHIAAIARAVADQEPRKIPSISVHTRLSGLEPFNMAA
ncbi:homocysteine S-methyltransferase family protein [Parasphingorhabdus flavimaris]|uniref:Homocysteine S-methyltransferase family protein n=1 Tax=Parasphingorhabdus flavimaris TaxID=266812 RepID=A0ABX2MYD9_9SPHN|nr:homocysteine S-methyltransferase family protein [Parasphingorhabdus flavimaris]NVD26470.1 homocysteine S-methyltransferase family protein [Parasphingorhabdus flavimaris]|tara:strand:- start:15227 stop:16276 length:1050 start_codon:yes stop_codon:yes gene_type:complete